MTEDLVIRRATVEDAEEGARLHIACWQEGYANIMSAEALADFTADEQVWVRRWRAQILDGTPRYLAWRDGRMVGLSLAGLDPESGSDIPVLFAIYVRVSEYGSGLAQRLLDVSLGGSAATLWVFAENERARAFYARNGFVPTGRTQTEEQLGPVEIEMARPAPSL